MASLRLLRTNLLRRSIGTLHHSFALSLEPAIETRGSFCGISSKISSLEGFVSHLLRNKPKPVENVKVSIDLDNWSQTDIDNNLGRSFITNDRATIDDIITELIAAKRLPSDAWILQVLSHLCDKNAESMDKVVRLIEVVEEKNIAFYATNIQFTPFLAQHLWKMEKFDEALRMLNGFFRASPKTQPSSVRQNYRQIIFDAIQSHDDIVVHKVVDSARLVFERHKEPALLIYLWGDCFCSDLFRNQILAEELFEEMEVIRRKVAKDINVIVASLVDEGNVAALHRLIELCLKYDWRVECEICLIALFDYHYWRNDLRACTEVMSSFQSLKIIMPDETMSKLVNMVLKKEKKQPIKATKSPTVSRFEFKF